MPQPVYKNDSAVLYYHPVEKIVHHEILHRPTTKEFKELLMEGYEVLRRNRAVKWLSDDRQHTVLAEEDEKWAQAVWFPLVQKAGWLFWAVVNPAKAVGQLQMKHNADFMRIGGVTVNIVSTPEEAMEWLKKVDRPGKKAG
jgi:hypothetical protein